MEKRHFELKFEDYRGNAVELHIERDVHAESILRGLIHSGIAVTIREVIPPEKKLNNTTEYYECCPEPAMQEARAVNGACPPPLEPGDRY
jgi:hypothetical protein